jgi:hypothetical protein
MSIVNDIVASFYSSGFYSEVAHMRRGIGFKFMFALTLITTLLITGFLIFYSGAMNKFAAEIPVFASDLPGITVKGGKFAMDKPSPYTIPIGSGADAILIRADTNFKGGDMKTVKDYMEANKIAALITQDDYIVRKENGTLEYHSFSDFKEDITITHQKWMELAGLIAEKGVNFLIISSFLILFPLLFIYNLIATFISSLFIMLLSLAMSAGLELATSMRLAAAARMPTYAIIFAPLMIGGGFISGILGWLVWVGYIVFAVNSSRRIKV